MAEVTEQPQDQQQQPAQPEAPAQPQPAVLAPSPSGNTQFYGTGRRKRGVARVFLRAGTGVVTVNGRAFEDYFPTPTLRTIIQQPLAAVELNGRFDIQSTVIGGGLTGQAGSIRLGIARALLEYDVALRKQLKKLGFL